MKIIIPVAGAGTRLHPHTLTIPKPLLIAGNKPVIAHVVEPLLSLPVDEFVFVVGYKGEMIREFLTKSYQTPMRFVTQDQLHGLGYAIHLALKEIAGGPVLIVLGDTIIECDFSGFVGAGDYVLGLREVSDPHRFGIAEVTAGKIVGLEEKPKDPKTNLAVIGLYYFSDCSKLKAELNKLVAEDKRTRGEIQLTDALQHMIHDGTSFVPFNVSGWYDCGKKETLIQTSEHLLKQLPQPTPKAGSAFVPPLYIAPTAKVSNSVIGPNVSIMDNAVVTNSVISHSIIAQGAKVEQMVMHQSLVGPQAVVRGQNKSVDIGESAVTEYA